VKRIILLGNVSCGKTTLCQRLFSQEISYKKTQAVELVGDAIDTPGEYVQNKRLYRALITTAADADMVLILQSATDPVCMFSPGMGSMFQKPMTGVVTKIDMVQSEAQLAQAETYLRLAGADPILHISSLTGQGIPELIGYLTKDCGKIVTTD